MDEQSINQKLDKILEYQEQQARFSRTRFWMNFGVIVIFVILPLILLPIMISKVFSLYAGGLDPEQLQQSTEQAQGLLDLFR